MGRKPTDDKFLIAGGFETTPMIDILTKDGIFEGYYLKSKVVESDKLENGRAIVHEFMTKEGELVGVWGAGQLDYRLKYIGEEAPKALVRITYLGKGTFKSKKGKKLPVHNFDVRYNPDDLTTHNA